MDHYIKLIPSGSLGIYPVCRWPGSLHCQVMVLSRIKIPLFSTKKDFDYQYHKMMENVNAVLYFLQTIPEQWVDTVITLMKSFISVKLYLLFSYLVSHHLGLLQGVVHNPSAVLCKINRYELKQFVRPVVLAAITGTSNMVPYHLVKWWNSSDWVYWYLICC